MATTIGTSDHAYSCPNETTKCSSHVESLANSAPDTSAPGDFPEHRILPRDELKRIKQCSRVLTKEEREAEMEAQIKPSKEEARAATEKSRVHMQQIDLNDQSLREMEAESAKKRERILERANNLTLEQEPEIKKLNKLILEVECQMVRDAQIEDKKRIQFEKQEEDRRLHAIIEEDRQNALEVLKQKDEKRKMENIIAGKYIRKQIEDHQMKEMLHKELKEQSRQETLEMQKKLEMEKKEALEKKIAEKKKLQLDIQKFNEESFLVKEQKKDADIKAHLYDQKYTRMKQEREEKFKAERQQKTMERIQRAEQLKDILEKNMAGQTEKELLLIHRQQLATEMDWNRKDKKEAKKKLEIVENLKAGRQEQINFKKQMLADQAARIKAESERCLRIQHERDQEVKKKEEQHKQKMMQSALELRQQIQYREAQAIARKKEKEFETTIRHEEADLFRARVEKLKEDKLQMIKTIPDKYYNTLLRKMN